MKKFLLRLVWVLPLFIAIGGLNYTLDVKSLFHRSAIDKAASWLQEGNNLLEVHLINSRYLQKKYIETLPKGNDVVVLGQSRCNKIGQEMFPDERFFNHWVPNGSMYEILAFYHLYEASGRLPKKIIIGLSPQTLNSDWKHKDKVLAKHYSNMCEQLGFSQFKVSFPETRNNMFLLQELFSANYLVTNLKYDRLVPKIADNGRQQGIYLSDGSSAQKSYMEGPKNLIQAQEIIDLEVLPISEIEDTEFALFGAFLKHLTQQKGIEVSFFVLPYHPLIYNQAQLKEPLSSWAERISMWASDYGIEVIGGLNPEELKLTDDDYLDIDHVSRDATGHIFEMHRNKHEKTAEPLR